MTLAQRIRLHVFLAQWRTVLFAAGVLGFVAFFVTGLVVVAATDPSSGSP